jgi:hypothetical protein
MIVDDQYLHWTGSSASQATVLAMALNNKTLGRLARIPLYNPFGLPLDCGFSLD